MSNVCKKKVSGNSGSQCKNEWEGREKSAEMVEIGRKKEKEGKGVRERG
jgi:hypothetical protein